ncbi:MAG: type I methionyl aminopeptidase [Chloroflexota bacterium]|nr:type I methionyl aminopeptidase [Chloroflexota bacterium]
MVIESRSDLNGLRRANRATARLLKHLARMAKPGVTTRALDDFARAYIADLGAIPVFHTEEGFPGAINTSVNDAALHGVPNNDALCEGDVLSIDAGMLLDGYCGDATITVAIGAVSAERLWLIETARGTMQAGIAAAVTGNRVGDIGAAMQQYAESRGFGVFRDFTGHGVGHVMHEAPKIPFVGKAGTGPLLAEGLVITIEPAIAERSARYRIDPDGWTVRTTDGGYAAQFEHTVIVTRRGAHILSQI